jgi:hypothetical protein
MGLWPHGKEHIKQHFVNKNERKIPHCPNSFKIKYQNRRKRQNSQIHDHSVIKLIIIVLSVNVTTEQLR